MGVEDEFSFWGFGLFSGAFAVSLRGVSPAKMVGNGRGSGILPFWGVGGLSLFNDFAHIPWEGTPDFPFNPHKEIPKQKLLVIRVKGGYLPPGAHVVVRS